jgi:hypothetical protein
MTKPEAVNVEVDEGVNVYVAVQRVNVDVNLNINATLDIDLEEATLGSTSKASMSVGSLAAGNTFWSTL